MSKSSLQNALPTEKDLVHHTVNVGSSSTLDHNFLRMEVASRIDPAIIADMGPMPMPTLFAKRPIIALPLDAVNPANITGLSKNKMPAIKANTPARAA